MNDRVQVYKYKTYYRPSKPDVSELDDKQKAAVMAAWKPDIMVEIAPGQAVNITHAGIAASKLLPPEAD